MRRISVLGSDARFTYAAIMLSKNGFIVTDPDLKTCVYDAEYFLLPVPLTVDKEYIKGTNILVEEFLEHIIKRASTRVTISEADRVSNTQNSNDISCGAKSVKLFCGMPPKEFVDRCAENGIEVIDYMKCEKLTFENAVLTAKGIGIEANEAGAVLKESSSLVLGYGFCGKAIANYLRDSGANVTIMARNEKLIPEIRKHGFDYVPMFKMLNEKQRLKMIKYSYIFNTIPAMVLDKEAIDCLSENVMIFDIASKPGGTDFEYCYENDIFAVNSLGIPGKHFPKEAGEIIAKVVIENTN